MRPSWDEYFMEIARVAATRSTCLRRKVGAALVKDKRILTTGYNGAPAGLNHCLDIGCLRAAWKFPPARDMSFAEDSMPNKTPLFRQRYTAYLSRAVSYLLHTSCVLCAKMIVNAGIRKVVFAGDYPDELSLEIFKEADIELQRFS
nr:cytidine/deoxycytidylate deaminase family protein [Desulforamulus aquiferis]